MTDETLKQQVSQALAAFADAPLTKGATHLLNALGYKSHRTAILGSVPKFKEIYVDGTEKGKSLTDKQISLFSHWKKVEIVFQVADSEIKDVKTTMARKSGTNDMFGDKSDSTVGFEESMIKSFLFMAVDMKDLNGKRGDKANNTPADQENHNPWTRTQLADTARAVNKLFGMPVILLFRHGTSMTMGVTHRRVHKKNEDRDVLEKVTLIKDIRFADPHRAHLDILCDLSLTELITSGVDSFDKLHNAWERILNIEALNRQFYREVYAWSEWAAQACKFPNDRQGEGSDQRHVIRMITRLLFIWFLKEKGLVPPELFEHAYASNVLKKYDSEGTEYYKAVLQNLFFATLNTEIDKREFSRESKQTHRVFNKFRYRSMLKSSKDFLALMKQVPFVNGGLFDCLDDFESVSQGGIRIDVFSDNEEHAKALHVPANLFFGDSEDNGHGKGLFDIFRRYKFTIEESTPIEQEVALDPELLGSVFENLLASYNPETREHARKATGSYYTPRKVVEYMVCESLAEALSIKVEPADGDDNFFRERLLYLMDWQDEQADYDVGEFFQDEAETRTLVAAIADLKTLDPAVGSGAFPMGVLQILTLALRRLDPSNMLWEEVQVERATKRAKHSFESEDDKGERSEALDTINETFETYRDSDYGRKLYLIQNGIFGVDIQPIACQIAKLRFFITLIIEQQSDPKKSNFGIKPLPNLETRFVAGDTLIAPKTPADDLLFEDSVIHKRLQIESIREQYFLANSRQEKDDFRKTEKKLRNELKELLEKIIAQRLQYLKKNNKTKMNAFSNKDDRNMVREEGVKERKAEEQRYKLFMKDAEMIASWDPYNQNAHVDWFDPKHMFGVDHGFDVVIGNPPYIQLQKNKGKAGNLYKDMGYETFTKTGDIYQLFYERGCQLLNQVTGVLAYITSNSWLKAAYGKSLRLYFSDHHKPIRLIELGKNVFENAIVDTSIILVRSGGESIPFPAVDMDRSKTTKGSAHDLDELQLEIEVFPPPDKQWHESRPNSDLPWLILSKPGWSIIDKIYNIGTPLKEWNVEINRGIITGYNPAFIINSRTRDAIVKSDPKSEEIIKPILRGEDMRRWRAVWDGLWLISTFPSLNIDIDNYHAIKKHLLSFGKERLEQSGASLENGIKARKKTTNAWYETSDSIAYHDNFNHEKLFWMHMSPYARFALAGPDMLCNQKVFIITGDNLWYLCAILNSKLITWLMSKIGVTTGMGLTQWDKFVVESVSIPHIENSEQQPLINLVDTILAAKDDDLNADVSEQEAAIDHIVYSLYSLSSKEIKTVESMPF